jgi:hypothetical protein
LSSWARRRGAARCRGGAACPAVASAHSRRRCLLARLRVAVPPPAPRGAVWRRPRAPPARVRNASRALRAWRRPSLRASSLLRLASVLPLRCSASPPPPVPPPGSCFLRSSFSSSWRGGSWVGGWVGVGCWVGLCCCCRFVVLFVVGVRLAAGAPLVGVLWVSMILAPSSVGMRVGTHARLRAVRCLEAHGE